MHDGRLVKQKSSYASVHSVLFWLAHAHANAWFKVSLVCNAKIIVHAKQGQTDRSNLHSTLEVQTFGQDELIPNCGATSNTFATFVEQKHSILHCLLVRQKHISLSFVKAKIINAENLFIVVHSGEPQHHNL